MQHIINNRGHVTRNGNICDLALDSLCRARQLTPVFIINVDLWHAHHHLGDTVSFLFVFIAGLADNHLGLHTCRAGMANTAKGATSGRHSTRGFKARLSSHLAQTFIKANSAAALSFSVWLGIGCTAACCNKFNAGRYITLFLLSWRANCPFIVATLPLIDCPICFPN